MLIFVLKINSRFSFKTLFWAWVTCDGHVPSFMTFYTLSVKSKTHKLLYKESHQLVTARYTESRTGKGDLTLVL